MAVEIIDGVKHIFAPNPKMQGESWEQEFPPIVTTSKWLVNKFTGEIFPNTVEFARRSDILEPYLGELSDDMVNASEVVDEINKAIGNEPVNDVLEKQPAGELTTL